jgi:tetratricopeptide (TPR) repeat protein
MRRRWWKLWPKRAIRRIACETPKNENNATPRIRFAAPRGWLMPLIITFCAAGAGVTGTMLWMQNRPAQRTSEPVASTPSTPSASTSSSTHEPPATLTAGMMPAQTALTLGNWYYDHERWTVAIAQYQKAIAGGLDSPDVRTDLGNCYRFAEQPQKALEQYRLAQKQNPQHEQSLFNQGGVYASELKQSDKAIAAWRKYLQVFPNGQSVAEARQLIAQMQAQQVAKP